MPKLSRREWRLVLFVVLVGVALLVYLVMPPHSHPGIPAVVVDPAAGFDENPKARAHVWASMQTVKYFDTARLMAALEEETRQALPAAVKSTTDMQQNADADKALLNTFVEQVTNGLGSRGISAKKIDVTLELLAPNGAEWRHLTGSFRVP